MCKLLIYFVLILNPLLLFSQDTIHGEVFDLGTQQPVSGVSILGLHSGREVFTNSSGEFSFITDWQPDNNLFPDEWIHIKSNILWYNLPTSSDIELYDLAGKRLFYSSAQSNGSMHLPAHPSGFSLLRLSHRGKGEATLLLQSDGQNVRAARAERFSKEIQPPDSALLFSKNGWFSITDTKIEPHTPYRMYMLKKGYDSLDFFLSLTRYEAFEMLHSSPPLSNFGEVQSVKVLYDFIHDTIYYINLAKYPSHYSFAWKVLGYSYGVDNFFWTQYYNCPARFLYLATINYHSRIDKYAFEFDSYDMIDCAGIEATYQKILNTSFLGDKLVFFPNNLRWASCENIPMISSQELYQGQNYQAMNVEENYGFLRKIDVTHLDEAYPGRHDIVMLNGVPNSMPVVAGIITTEFQTALSHINILSHNRKTPNMVLRDGFTNPSLDSLLGKLVHLKVEPNTYSIRTASLSEAEEFWQQREPSIPVVLETDIAKTGIIELQKEGTTSVKWIGGKAANFAELVTLGDIPLPEDHFAIPFYYYMKHIENNHLDTIISNILHDARVYIDQSWRDERLENLREAIVAAPLDAGLLAMVQTRIHDFQFFDSYKFRSSTNAEDLENFSGAGLYDSFAAKKGSSSKSVDKAIKKVWASLWNLRAFDEREYYKIDQTSVAMGILVNRSSPDEDANGVIITKNLYNSNHAYTVNVQFKEFSVVSPEPGVLHDQILIHTISLDTLKYTLEYISRSNIPALAGNTVLTNEELYAIGDLCTRVKLHYYYNVPHHCNCSYNDFAVDIEFKIDSQVEPRKIYFKQARIYSSQ